MEISKGALGIVAAVCVVAGAGGVYVATRTGQAVPATPTQVANTAAAPSATAGVEQSEGAVNDATAPTTTAPAAIAPLAAPRKSTESRPARPRETRTARKPATEPRTPAPAPQDAPALAPPALEPPPRVADASPAQPPAPAAPQYYDLVIPADAVIGLQVDTPVSSDTARVEDRVTARVTRDVKVGDHIAVPAGSRAEGEVTLVDRGGKLKDRARLGVRFTSIVLGDGTRVPIDTEAIYREGENPTTASAAKIGGGAIGGAIIGGLLGGAKGAILGSTIGGGAGTAAVEAGGRKPATLSEGSPVTVRLQQPATVTVERE